jgi:hypothetical protein
MTTEESKNWYLKLVELLMHFKTPVQLGALCLVILYLLITGPYDGLVKAFFVVAIAMVYFGPIILRWQKTQTEVEIPKRKIDVELEKSLNWNYFTQSGMIERSLVEGQQRKQGALDVYEKLIALLKESIEKCKLERGLATEKKVYENLLERISNMKDGLENFPLGFHEQANRERMERRGRFVYMRETKEEDKKGKEKEKPS